MKRFLSIMLAVLMILSNVSYAIPSAIGAMDTAIDAPIADIAETADLAEVQTNSNTYGTLIYQLNFDAVTTDTAAPQGSWNTTLGDWGHYVNWSYITAYPRLWTRAGGTVTKIEEGNSVLRYNLPFSGNEIINFGTQDTAATSSVFAMKTGNVYTVTFDMRVDTGNSVINDSGENSLRRVRINTDKGRVDISVPSDGEWHTYAVPYETSTDDQNFTERIDLYLNKYLASNMGSVTGTFDLDNISIYQKPSTAIITVVNKNGETLDTISGVSTKGVKVSTIVDGLYTGDAVVNFDGKEYALTDTITFGGDSTIELVFEVPEESENYNKTYGTPLYQLHFNTADAGTSVGSGHKTYDLLAPLGYAQTADIKGNYPRIWFKYASTVQKESDNGYLRFALPTAAAGDSNELFDFLYSNQSVLTMEAGYVYTVTFDSRVTLDGSVAAPTSPSGNYNFIRDNDDKTNTVAVEIPADSQWHTYSIEYKASGHSYWFYQSTYSDSKYSGHGYIDFDNFSIYKKPETATIKVVDADGEILKTNTGVSTKGVTVSTLITDIPGVEAVVFDGKTYSSSDTIVFGGNSTVEVVFLKTLDAYNSEFTSEAENFTYNVTCRYMLTPSWDSNGYAKLTFNQAATESGFFLPTIYGEGSKKILPEHDISDIQLRMKFTGLTSDVSGTTSMHYDPATAGAFVAKNNFITSSYTIKNDEWFTFSIKDMAPGVITYIKENGLGNLRFDLKFDIPKNVVIYIDYIRYYGDPLEVTVDTSVLGDGYETAITTEYTSITTIADLISAIGYDGDVSIAGLKAADGTVYSGTALVADILGKTDGNFTVEANLTTTATVTIVDQNNEPIVTRENVGTSGVLVSELINGLYDASDITKIAYVIFNGQNYNPEDEIVFGTDSTVTLVVEDNPYFSEQYGIALYQLHFNNVTAATAAPGGGWKKEAATTSWGVYTTDSIITLPEPWLLGGSSFVKEGNNGFLRYSLPLSDAEVFDFGYQKTATLFNMKKGNTYTITYDVRANATGTPVATQTVANGTQNAIGNISLKDWSLVNVPNDNQWHTISYTYTPTADEAWDDADDIYFYQYGYTSVAGGVTGGTFDFDNITIYEMESVPTTVKFNMQNGNSAASDIVVSDEYNVDENGNIIMDPNSTLDLNEIASFVIDEGDMDFIGFNTDPDATTALDSVTSTAMGGEIQLYAIWAEQDVNELYSVEFDTNSGYSMFSQKKQDGTYNDLYYNFGGKGTIYQEGYDPRNTPLTENGFITHDGNGYITLNYDATEGYNAIYNAYFFLGSLDKEAYISANSGIEKMVIRARVRGENALAGGSYTTASGTNTYTPTSFAPVNALHYGAEETAGLTGFSGSLERVDLTSIGANQWFTYEIDVTSITDAIHYMRLDMNYTMPHGTKLDIDYIRFIGGDIGELVSHKESTSIRASKSGNKNGVRVIASAPEKIAADNNGATDIGYMFASSAKWSKAGYVMEDLTMDKFNDSSINDGGKLIIAGFLRQDGKKLVEWFNNENDTAPLYSAVLYNIPTKNYKSNFIVRPFSKINGVYTYGEPFEVNFLEVANKVYNTEDVNNNPTLKTYIETSNKDYEEYLAAAEVSGNIDENFTSILATPSSVNANLIIPTNDTKPVKISDDYYTVTAWKNGTMESYTVYTKGTFPAIIDAEGNLTAAYADEPCVIAETGLGSYYLKSLAHSRAGSENGDANGINTSLSDFDGDSTSTVNMLASHVDNPASPVQRHDEATSGVSSFFLGDYAYGTYEYTYSAAGSATKHFNLGKTAVVDGNTKFVAKYVLPDETLWTTYSASQLNTLADNTDEWSNGEQGTAYFTTYPHGLEFNRLTYVVKNNTAGINSTDKRDREDLVLLAGVIDVPTASSSTSNQISGRYDASLYKKILVKTSNSISSVTVKFTRDDGKTGSITSTCYATVGDERLFDIDLYGVPEYHGTITKFNIYKNTSSSIGSNLKKVYLVANGHDSSAALTKTSSAFDDEGFGNGFVVRDLDQEYNKSSFTGTLGYFNAANQSNVAWAVNPWYAYDYSNNSANKANYELTANGTTLSDAAGSKVIKYNSGVNINGTTSDTLTMTLNASKIYNGKSHSQMVNEGMTYWPHLLLEQNTEIPSVADKKYAVNADVVKAEMDIRMTSMSGYGDNKTEFLVYVYLRPKDDPTQRIWFGIQLFSSSSTMKFPNWKRDTGASQYIYSIPQEIVYGGEANAFWTSKTSWGSTTYSVAPSSTWKHIDLDLTDHIDRALDWINREDGFGLGKVLTKDDIYIDGVNLGFETHGGVDATFEIANFNINSYSAN